jgi:hypothetical protein
LLAIATVVALVSVTLWLSDALVPPALQDDPAAKGKKTDTLAKAPGPKKDLVPTPEQLRAVAILKRLNATPVEIENIFELKAFAVSQGLFVHSGNENGVVWFNFLIADHPIVISDLPALTDRRTAGLTPAWRGVLWVVRLAAISGSSRGASTESGGSGAMSLSPAMKNRWTGSRTSTGSNDESAHEEAAMPDSDRPVSNRWAPVVPTLAIAG